MEWTKESILSYFDYDAEQGKLFYKARRRVRTGDEAGFNENGKRKVIVDGVKYKSRDLIYFLETGKRYKELYPLDRDHFNTKFSNLTPIKQPYLNRKIPVYGVSQLKENHQYYVRVYKDKKQQYQFKSYDLDECRRFVDNYFLTEMEIK